MVELMFHHITQISHVIWIWKTKCCTILQRISQRDIRVQSAYLQRLSLGPELFCFPGEAAFRRRTSMFCFPLWRPSDLFNKLVEYWLTVNGHIGLEAFFFYPLLLLHFATLSSVDVMIRASGFCFDSDEETCRIFCKWYAFMYRRYIVIIYKHKQSEGKAIAHSC